LEIQKKYITLQEYYKTKMEETINLTIEELDQIKAIQENYTQLTTAFGQVEIAFVNLREQKDSLKQSLATFKEQEMEFGKALQEKYGVGNIDLETGEFTKAETN
jgi:hypothetical protein